MAWDTHFRKRYDEYIREVVGDKDAILFDADELLAYVETHIATQLTSHVVPAYNNRYNIRGCGCSKLRGIYMLAVTGGVDGAVYILDEQTGLVIFDPNDPLNTAVAPVDTSTITVQYYMVNTAGLLKELFVVLSSNHAKLVLAHNIMGVSMDLKELSDSFYAQAVRWAYEGQDCCG